MLKQLNLYLILILIFSFINSKKMKNKLNEKKIHVNIKEKLVVVIMI